MFSTCKPAIIALFAISLLSSPGCGHAASPSGLNRLGYAIQMGAFAEVKNAERFTDTLQKKGIEAFYFRKDNGIYAVRFGDFATKDKARAAAKRLVADRLIGGYYIAPPNEIVFARPREAGWQKSAGEEITSPRLSAGSKTARDKGTPRTGKIAESVQPRPARGDRDMGAIAARTAERFVGIPYRWGGENVVDGMDCSGFVRAVYNLCGLSIPRTSRDQFKAGDQVAKDDLRDGDLLFFGSSADSISHVGIYVGSGRFVHAPRRGEDIKVSAVDESYFERHFIGARRYFQ
ncbi:peptidoglycan-binding protein [Oryzomonas japonica]|uniref:Peptidoglycan-binding protein n=1 Tax=Oryzomonas japonica TaxID=2603858 RepID=A0A7J4ZN00_9BACT|nr:NlpC/P60 family protein [Oryzomonas japonica]KAB0664099.1 peptidoglycan-binding protein [Oryzomonas japonica]